MLPRESEETNVLERRLLFLFGRRTRQLVWHDLVCCVEHANISEILAHDELVDLERDRELVKRLLAIDFHRNAAREVVQLDIVFALCWNPGSVSGERHGGDADGERRSTRERGACRRLS